MILGMGYQEDVIETNLLDFVENRWREPGKIISMENVRNPGKREARGQKKKEIPPPKAAETRRRGRWNREFWKRLLQTADTAIC